MVRSAPRAQEEKTAAHPVLLSREGRHHIWSKRTEGEGHGYLGRPCRACPDGVGTTHAGPACLARRRLAPAQCLHTVADPGCGRALNRSRGVLYRYAFSWASWRRGTLCGVSGG